MLADIWVAKTQAAEVAFLVGLIVFLLSAYLAKIGHALWSVGLCVGAAALALGWMLL
jgi:hypothetical protein